MKFLLNLLVFLFITHAFCQKKEGKILIDSLAQAILSEKNEKYKADTYNNIAKEYRKIDINFCETYANKALELSKKIKYNNGIAYSYRNLGIVSASKSNFEEALLNYDLGLKNTTSKKIRGEIIGSIGKVYSQKSDYPKTLKYFFESLQLFEEINDKELQAITLQNIGNIYIAIDDIEKAKLYRKKLDSIKKISNVIDETPIQKKSNIDSKINCLVVEKDTAIKNNYYLEALQNATKNGLNIEKNKFLINECRLLIDTKKYDKALQILTPFLKQEEVKPNNETQIAAIYYQLGDIYYFKSKQEKITSLKNEFAQKSIESYEKSIQLISKLNLLDEKQRRYYKLHLAFKQNNNFEKSLLAYEKSSIYKDSIFNFAKKETIKNLEDKREIDLKTNEIKITNLTLEANKKQKFYLIGGLFLLAIIGSLLFYQSKNRKKINEKLQLLNQNLDLKNTELDQANKAKTRFFSILNHDLRGPVANLVFFLQLQKESPEMLDEESTKRMQDKTMAGAENLLASMEDILQWSKSQMENFKPQPKNMFIKSIFEDTKNHFASEEKIQIIFENPNNIQINTDENYLKTIIRNLTGNSMKAIINVQNPTIIWKAFQENGNTILSITDNGIGASDEQFKALYDDKEVVGIKTGLGLHLIRDLAKAIDCEITVDSKIDEGTTITLKFS